MARKLSADKVLFGVTVGLVLIGVIMVFVLQPCWPTTSSTARFTFFSDRGFGRCLGWQACRC